MPVFKRMVYCDSCLRGIWSSLKQVYCHYQSLFIPHCSHNNILTGFKLSKSRVLSRSRTHPLRFNVNFHLKYTGKKRGVHLALGRSNDLVDPRSDQDLDHGSFTAGNQGITRVKYNAVPIRTRLHIPKTINLAVPPLACRTRLSGKMSSFFLECSRRH
jgi:hypothetical protein